MPYICYIITKIAWKHNVHNNHLKIWFNNTKKDESSIGAEEQISKKGDIQKEYINNIKCNVKDFITYKYICEMYILTDLKGLEKNQDFYKNIDDFWGKI